MTTTALAAVEQLAAFMQLPLADDDATAILLLNIASGMVRRKLKQQLDYVGDDAVTLDPINGTYVQLREFPIVAVSLVEMLDAATQQWVAADPSTYTVSRATGMIGALPGTGVYWPTTPESWRVTYTHGFEELPDDLLGVVLGVAARAYSSPAGIESERVGAYQVKYAVESSGFSGIEDGVLIDYRRPGIS
jgi:hypothetical protein